jgi:PleD family two-component response regulator
MKILVVDDNSDICQMIETILLSEGYEAVSCINPLIAGAMVKKHKPKLLITDILMRKILLFFAPVFHFSF